MNCGQERGVTWHHDPSSVRSPNPRTCELCTHATQSKSVFSRSVVREGQKPPLGPVSPQAAVMT